MRSYVPFAAVCCLLAATTISHVEAVPARDYMDLSRMQPAHKKILMEMQAAALERQRNNKPLPMTPSKVPRDGGNFVWSAAPIIPGQDTAFAHMIRQQTSNAPNQMPPTPTFLNGIVTGTTWRPIKEGHLHTAFVKFENKQSAFLKCSTEIERAESELIAFNQLATYNEKLKTHLGRNHVISKLADFKYNNALCIVLSLGGQMDLREFMSTIFYSNAPKGMRVALISSFSYQLLQGLAFMHEARLAHNDIKPDNIMVDLTDINRIKLTIIDMDLASVMQPLDRYGPKPDNPKGGTHGYYAPESVVATKYDLRKGDSWSAICTLFDFYYNITPFGLKNVNNQWFYKSDQEYYIELKELYNSGTDDQVPAKFNGLDSQAEYKQITLSFYPNLEKAFIINPKLRWTPQQILKGDTLPAPWI